MRPQLDIRERLGHADERESAILVLLVVATRIRVVELALEHFRRTRDVPALLAEAREAKPRPAGGVEDVLLCAARYGANAAVRQLELDSELTGCRSQRSSSMEPRLESHAESAPTDE
jgi:hypothetical protein